MDKRRKQIEEYLVYINNHKYLSYNPVFKLFLTDEFERYKEEYNKHSKLIDRIKFIRKFLPDFLKINKYKTDIDNEDEIAIFLSKEKDNINRLEEGVNDSYRSIVIIYIF
jgi:hypothetical protein